MKQINKIHLDIKCTFSILLFFILFVIITDNTFGQEQSQDNLGNWLKNNRSSLQGKMYEKEIVSRIAGGTYLEYGSSNYFKELFQFNEPVTTYGLGTSILFTFSGLHHYNQNIIIDELNYFETLFGYKVSSTGREAIPTGFGEYPSEGSSVIALGFGIGKSYNTTNLNRKLISEGNLDVYLLNSKDNSFLELGSIYGYEFNLSYQDYHVKENNRPNDDLDRASNSFLFTDYFKSFVCYRLTGNTALELGVKRNLVYGNLDFVLESLGSKAVESTYFYLLDYLVTQPLLKSGDENTYIYNFLMQNAASLIFYSLKKDNYSFPLSGGRTYSAYNIYFGLRF